MRPFSTGSASIRCAEKDVCAHSTRTKRARTARSFQPRCRSAPASHRPAGMRACRPPDPPAPHHPIMHACTRPAGAKGTGLALPYVPIQRRRLFSANRRAQPRHCTARHAPAPPLSSEVSRSYVRAPMPPCAHRAAGGQCNRPVRREQLAL